jgi:hypothetical protein
VIGERRIDGVGVVAAGAVVGVLPPAAAPPVEVARAGVAPLARIVKLPRNVLRVRTRKATTSFVGLRG